MSMHPEPERDRRILGALVQGYIDDGEPISSPLAVRAGISSATLRNILARLEEQHVRQPHTSAGRVPTDLGYRCYVDQLAERRSSRPRPRSKRGSGAPGPSTICSRTHHRKSPEPLNS